MVWDRCPGRCFSCGDTVILAAHSQSATLFLGASSGGATCNTDIGNLPGSMPVNYPKAAPVSFSPSWCYEMNLVVCGAATTATVTPSSTATNTPTPSDTPTPTPTPGGPVTLIYVNSEGACCSAFGCTVTCVEQCRALYLDQMTSYIIMRICALCGGCQPADLMQLRATGLGWDEICAHYGIDWATFTTDLQTRINTLLPETDSPCQLLRGAAYNPNPYPIEYPTPMPDILTQTDAITEACPLCQ